VRKEYKSEQTVDGAAQIEGGEVHVGIARHPQRGPPTLQQRLHHREAPQCLELLKTSEDLSGRHGGKLSRCHVQPTIGTDGASGSRSH
jgi:hypothetical protein